MSFSYVLQLFNITLKFNDINVLKHVNDKRVISLMGHDQHDHVQPEAWNEPADKVDELVGGVTEIVVDLINVSYNLNKEKVEFRSHSDIQIVVNQPVIDSLAVTPPMGTKSDGAFPLKRWGILP